MRDVIIIGGGLSGLAAAHELHHLRIPFTLIEVNRRLGGSIASDHKDGFVLDAGAMWSEDTPDAPFIDAFGLADDVIVPRPGWLALKSGVGALITRLAQPIFGEASPNTLMNRMAVSTIGEDGGRFYICMENGMVFDTRAVIVAAPARYAERIFHPLKPEISYRLLDYRYDTIARVSLGYRQTDALHIPDTPPADYPMTYIHTLDSLRRVPLEHVLIQIGYRYDPAKGVPADVVGGIAALMGWSLAPSVEQVDVWTEADPLMWLDENHIETMRAIQALLPRGVAIANSDYVPKNSAPTLQDRITQGRQAARRIANALGAKE